MRTVIFFPTLILLSSYTECSQNEMNINKISSTPNSITNISTSNISSVSNKRKRSSSKSTEPNDLVFTFGTPEKSLLIEYIKDVIRKNISGKLESLTITEEIRLALKDHYRHSLAPGYTLMHLAAVHDNDEAIRWLNSFGCDTNAFMGKGCTPLQTAALKGNLKAVKALLSIPTTNPYISSSLGRTAFMPAVHYGYLDIMNEFLGLPRINLRRLLNATDSDGISVLEMAYIGNREMLNNGQFVLPADLKQIYEKANNLVIKRLLDFADYIQPDPEFIVRLFAFDRENFNYLAKKMPTGAVRALKLVDIDLISLAIKENDFELLRKIHTFHPPNFFNSSGSLPIHLAASIGSKDAVMFYLNEYGISVDVKNASGQTIEDLAKINGNEELIKTIELLEIIKEIDII